MSTNALSMILSTVRTVAIGSLFCLTFGCSGGRDPSWEPTYPVTGKVTFNGQPIADAVVTFSPEGTKPVAIGRTDAEGRYTLTTYEQNDGAVAGDYVVLVSKIDQSLMPKYPEGPDDPAWATFDAAKADRDQAAASVLPAKYNARSTSGLTATVASSSENVVDLDLKK